MTALCSAGMGEGVGPQALLPQLGECLRIPRAYLSTGRCVIAVCSSLLPAGRGEDLITPRDHHARTGH